jgi:prephenate dehydratase
VRIAYQGEPGAFSEAAAHLYRPDSQARPCPAFEDVFDAVERGVVDCGILPIENSIGGTIHRNYDLLIAHDLQIRGEVELPVVHNLVALPGVALDEIRHVYSHPQALAQCDRFLRSLAGVEVVATYDTAGSALLVSQRGDRTEAAIASARAAEVFGLAILRASIQDFADNVTRFLVVGRPGGPEPAAAAGSKTTIVFALPNEAGSLFKALSVFALRGIDLTKLESRPLPGRPWEYLFYVDLAIGAREPACGRALAHLGEFATSLRVLGTYPAYRGERGRAGEPAAQDASCATPAAASPVGDE